MWEYKVVPIMGALYVAGFPFDLAVAQSIDTLGKDNWELVAILDVGNKEHVAYFKRKISG